MKLNNIRGLVENSSVTHLQHRHLGEDLWNQTSFEKIVRWAELRPEWFLDNAQRRVGGGANFFARIRDTFSIKITFLNLYWSPKLYRNPSVSNSHNCPHNGVSNRGEHDPDRPTGYPGWIGCIEFQTSHELPGSQSDIMDGTRIHISKEHDGLGRTGYSVKFFEDDWPGLVKGQTWGALKSIDMGRVSIGNLRQFR